MRGLELNYFSVLTFTSSLREKTNRSATAQISFEWLHLRVSFPVAKVGNIRRRSHLVPGHCALFRLRRPVLNACSHSVPSTLSGHLNFRVFHDVSNAYAFLKCTNSTCFTVRSMLCLSFIKFALDHKLLCLLLSLPRFPAL